MACVEQQRQVFLVLRRRIIINEWNTNLSNIFFAFTPFGAGSGAAGPDAGVNYFWGLGTVKGEDNVLTLNVRMWT